MIRIIQKHVLILAASCALASCASLQPASQSVGVPVDYCAALHQLVDAHKQGFAAVRGNRTHTRFADIWDAQVDVIGKDCQIWESGKGAVHYVCTRSAPNVDVARDYYDEGANSIGACLGPDWQRSESELEPDASYLTRFVNPAEAARVLIQRTRSRSILGAQWSIIYMVGNVPE